jgi:hypothetical protein
MNRIRKHNNRFQVLIAPHQKYNPGFEFLLGSWTDEGLMGFQVLEFNTYYEAEKLSIEQPDINWDQLVEFHKDAYVFLRSQINDVLKKTNIAVQLKSYLLTPIQTKNKMFDRVLRGQNGNDETSFRLVYDMNDIISFIIVNPWTRNLQEIETYLLNHERLNIFNTTRQNGVVHLIGRTDIGTTYEILLIPSLLDNWMEWRNLNSNILPNSKLNAGLRECIKTQRNIDKTFALR